MRHKLIIGLIVLQVLGLVGWYGWQWAGLRGESYLLRTQPVDPRDWLRGDFIILNYEISSLPEGMELPGVEWGQRVFVQLKPEGEFWVIDRVLTQRPATIEENRPLLRASLQGSRLVYDLERYFVPEGKGNPPLPITVEIAVNRQGKPLIKRIYADSQRWP